MLILLPTSVPNYYLVIWSLVFGSIIVSALQVTWNVVRVLQ